MAAVPNRLYAARSPEGVEIWIPASEMPTSEGGGDLLKANNLSDVASVATSRTNLGIGTAGQLASDTDGTLAADSDLRIATQKATKTYVDAHAATPEAIESVLAALGFYAPITKVLDAEDLQVIEAAPYELVPAPGPGKIIWPLSILLAYDLNGAGLQINSFDGNVYWGDNSGATPFIGAGPLIDGVVDNTETPWLNTLIPVAIVPTISSGTARYKAMYGGIELDLAVNQPLVIQSINGMELLGSIVSTVLNDGGSGYAIGDTFTVDPYYGSPSATGTVTGETAGVVTSYTINTPGVAEYSDWAGAQPIGTTATSGGGSGLLIDVTAVNRATNLTKLLLKVFYTIIDSPSV